MSWWDEEQERQLVAAYEEARAVEQAELIVAGCHCYHQMEYMDILNDPTASDEERQFYGIQLALQQQGICRQCDFEEYFEEYEDECDT